MWWILCFIVVLLIVIKDSNKPPSNDRNNIFIPFDDVHHAHGMHQPQDNEEGF